MNNREIIIGGLMCAAVIGAGQMTRASGLAEQGLADPVVTAPAGACRQSNFIADLFGYSCPWDQPHIPSPKRPTRPVTPPPSDVPGTGGGVPARPSPPTVTPPVVVPPTDTPEHHSDEWHDQHIGAPGVNDCDGHIKVCK